eukprot:UN10834
MIKSTKANIMNTTYILVIWKQKSLFLPYYKKCHADCEKDDT